MEYNNLLPVVSVYLLISVFGLLFNPIPKELTGIENKIINALFFPIVAINFSLFVVLNILLTPIFKLIEKTSTSPINAVDFNKKPDKEFIDDLKDI